MAIVHEGTSYGVHWTIDDQGLLYIDSGIINCTDINPTWGWKDYRTQIQSVESGNISWQEGANAINMFSYCSNLTSLDLSNFDTSDVTDMSWMFNNCSSLTSLDLSNFNTSNVTNMNSMFSDCQKLTSLDLSSFDTSNVTNMRAMFLDCFKLKTLNLSNFDTSNVTNMNLMFSYCDLTSLDLSNFDTSNVTDMSLMFDNCSSLISLDLLNFDTSNVTNMRKMFGSCENLISLDLSNFDTSSVTRMDSMFYNCSNLTSLNLSSFNTINVANMESMFGSCENLISLNLSSFNTSNATNMIFMFSYCSNLISLDLSNFDTSSVTRMNSMFLSCFNLTSILVSNLWTTSQVTSASNMFYSCNSLSGGKGTQFDSSYVDQTYARIDGGSSAPGYLTDINETEMYARYNSTNKTLVIYRDGLNKYTNNQVINTITYMKGIEQLTGNTLPLWRNCSSSIKQVFILNEFKPLTAYKLFCDCKISSLDLSKLNTSNVTNMESMFDGCQELTSLDLSNFNTSNVTNMNNMFYNCTNLTTLNISNFDTSNVTNMREMFVACKKLTTLDLSSFDTSNVNEMRFMFLGCTPLSTLDLSNFDTSNVTDMMGMFGDCSNLTSINLSSFNTSNVANMREMFGGCSNLTSLDLSNFNTSNVTNMIRMFYGCSNLTSLDLSSFDTSSVAYMFGMFGNCSKLSCNFYIKNTPDSVLDIFNGTLKPIYIIYNVSSYESSDSVAAFWRTIASQYQNVHFEADDHKPYPPQISGSVERVDADDPTKISPEGTKAKLTVSIILNNTLIPQNVIGVAANRLTQSSNITVGVDGDDPITITVGDTVIDLTQQLRLSEDKHIFICTVTDINASNTIVLELSKVQALLDFLGKGSRDKYVDKPGMGMAIGKLSLRNGLDIEFPTTIGKDLLPAIEYNLTTDTEVVSKRDYYEFDSNSGEYILVDPQEGDNPASEGWYDSSVKLNNYQLVVGKYNKRNNDATFIVGNGTSDLNRSNLMEIGDIITIGQTEQSRMEIDYRSMKLIDKEGFAYLDINDLCTNHTNEDTYGEGFYYVNTEEFEHTTVSTIFTLDFRAYHTNYTVLVDGVEITSGITKYLDKVIFDTTPPYRSMITIEYPTDSGAAKAYTLGRRVPIYKIGISSVCEGYSTAAPGVFSHAEGTNTISSGKASHTEGNSTYATGDLSHAEGNVTVASGLASHAEGISTTASGSFSHAEGFDSKAKGYASHAQNIGTVAKYDYQTAIGKYNDNKSTNAFEIGNGTDDDVRSNAFEVDWNGIASCRNPSGTFGSIFDLIYPVGAIYMSVNSTSPATLFGGTWERIQGRFLVGAGTNGQTGNNLLNLSAGATGGETNHTLKAAESGVPSHGHGFTQPKVTGGAVTDGITGGSHRHDTYRAQNAASGSNRYVADNAATANASHSQASTHTHNLPSHTHTVSGGAVSNNTAADAASAHNNLPPYLSVYIWKRTA